MYRLGRMLLCLAACGCTATMLNNPSHPGPYAPVDGAQIGVVRYRSGGLLGDARRQDAYKQMFEACRGRYKILGEDSEFAGAFAAPVGSAVLVRALDDRYIRFVCVAR